MNTRLTLGALAILLLFVPETRSVSACAPAPRHGDRVEIADESAIIVWTWQTADLAGPGLLACLVVGVFGLWRRRYSAC